MVLDDDLYDDVVDHLCNSETLLAELLRLSADPWNQRTDLAVSEVSLENLWAFPFIPDQPAPPESDPSKAFPNDIADQEEEIRDVPAWERQDRGERKY
jgi:hypothetical protein